MRRAASYLLLGAIFAIFGVFLLWPIYQVVRVGLFGVPRAGPEHFTLAYLQAVFLDPQLRRGLINSAIIAVGVTLLCTVIAMPLAMLAVRYDFAGKNAVTALLL